MRRVPPLGKQESIEMIPITGTDDSLQMIQAMRVQTPMPGKVFAGKYMLANYRPAKVGEPGKYWLENGEGEGMETSEEKIEAMFAEFFSKEF
jgi:hypothetical protein